MASWVASSNVSLTSVWPYSPALILSRAVQNQPGKPWLPITWVGIGGSAPVTRRSYQMARAVGNGGGCRGHALCMIGILAMHVRFWGTRGSIAAPGPGTARFGGNPSCVEVRASDGTVIILD